MDPLTIERMQMASAIRAPNTQRGYASDWRLFETWCNRLQRCALPAAPETLLDYLTELLNAGKKVSTARRHCTSIAHQHRQAGLDSPSQADTRSLLRGAQRLRREQPAQKAALTVAHLRDMCAALRGSAKLRARNRAILLLGFATALRRSTLVELNLGDLTFDEHGITVHVRHEKQDQAGVGRYAGVPFGHEGTCPVEAVKSWITYRGGSPGALFQSTRADRMNACTIALLVKAAVAAIGLDPDLYAGHSLRAGFVTEAVRCGVNEFVIAAHTGHRSLTALRRYFRRDVFRANACGMVGL